MIKNLGNVLIFFYSQLEIMAFIQNLVLRAGLMFIVKVEVDASEPK